MKQNLINIPISAEEIRQFIYCPRILYWRRVYHYNSYKSYSMQKGEQYHKYRQSVIINQTATHYHDHLFHNDDLNLRAKPDLILEYDTYIDVIEFKLFKPKFKIKSHIFQAIAGAISASYALNKNYHLIKIYQYNGNTSTHFISETDVSELIQILNTIRIMIYNQEIPEKTENSEKCNECEYRRICKYQ